MEIFEQIEDLQEAIQRLKNEQSGAIVGFVPTMGALHDGHLSLIEEAEHHSTIIICSIFVNPTQFNDSSDLEKYPRTVEADLEKLKNTACDIVFLPSVKEMYPDGVKPYEINFEGLDLVMEGKFRPGHFQGVAMVVERFFRIVQPNKAFFGRKDFQQVAIIKKMVQIRALGIEIIEVDIKRSQDGLALSSRNMLLSEQEKKEALVIYRTLLKLRNDIGGGMELEAAKHFAIRNIEESTLRLEYLEIVKDSDLSPVQTIEDHITCCVAAYCGSVRLIDNMQIN